MRKFWRTFRGIGRELLTLITVIQINIYIHSKHLSQSSLTMNSKAAFPLDVNRRFLGESFFFLCSLHLAESKPFFRRNSFVPFLKGEDLDFEQKGNLEYKQNISDIRKKIWESSKLKRKKSLFYQLSSCEMVSVVRLPLWLCFLWWTSTLHSCFRGNKNSYGFRSSELFFLLSPVGEWVTQWKRGEEVTSQPRATLHSYDSISQDLRFGFYAFHLC